MMIVLLNICSWIIVIATRFSRNWIITVTVWEITAVVIAVRIITIIMYWTSWGTTCVSSTIIGIIFGIKFLLQN